MLSIIFRKKIGLMLAYVLSVFFYNSKLLGFESIKESPKYNRQISLIKNAIAPKLDSINLDTIKLDSIKRPFLPTINNIPEEGVQTIKGLIRLKAHGTDKALTLVESEIEDLPVDESDNSQLLPMINNIPEIEGVQTIKGLIRLKAHGTDKALTLVESEIRYLPVDESDNRQLWWVIQDYEYHAFALSNASNTDEWIYYDFPHMLSISIGNKKTEEDPFLGKYLDKQYFFEFDIFEPNLTSSYTIRNLGSNNYMQTTNLDSEYIDWRLETGNLTHDRNAIYFDVEKFKSSGDSFVSLPMSETDDHTQIKESLSLVKIKANHLITDNKAYLSSSYGFLLNRLGGEDMFKITFDNLVTESMVGLLHYKATVFNNSFYQKEGNRKPIAGIGVKDNTIYLFNRDNIIKTTFKKEIPITFGYKKGELIANQLDKKESIRGVPTPTLINSTDGKKIKLLMRLPNGEVTIGYNPELILFGHNFEGKESYPLVMTNPYLSVLQDAEKRKTTFDWTTKTYNLRYKAYGKVIDEEVLSPFYYNDTEFSSIAAKYTDSGDYIGGEDFDYYDGWELIAHNFGYDRLGNEKTSSKLRGEPYMILYNRYTSRLRVFVYMSNPTIANNLKISLLDGPRIGFETKYQPAKLWGSYLQGEALDDPDLSTAEYSKIVKLKSETIGRFYFADFTLSYNPCIENHESNLRVVVSSVTQGDLEIVGKTQGGTIPVNSPAISNWLSNSNNYLTGVLNTPYGNLTTTLGDITFRNFKKWGAKDWGNAASFVLPGKKVEEWEKEAARFEYEGESTISSGEFLSGAGLIIEGTAEIATAADISHVSTSIGRGIGTIMHGAGTIIEGTGTALLAKAARLYYKNLRDEPDKTIKVTLPSPQPSVVFSELAARGSLSIETTIFDDVVITTPGSKNSELAPNEYVNGSRGSYPIYNEPLGEFNVLYQPKIALSIVKQSKDIGGYIRLKKHPYVVVNGNVDYSGGFFKVNYIVTTYEISGYSTESSRSKSYLLADKNIPGVESLSMELDISELLDKKTILDNINHYVQNGGNDIESKFNDWVKIKLEVEFFGYTGKDSNGTYGVSDLSNSYRAAQVSSYEDATGIDEDISSLLVDSSESFFGNSYLGDNIELWGEHYLISSTTDHYYDKIDSYCRNDETERTYPKKLEGRSIKTTQKNKKNNPKVLIPNLPKSIEKEGLLVYPNPSNGIFTIRYVPKETGKIEICVYDSNGNLFVTHTDYASSAKMIKKVKIDISNLRSGIYILEIRHKSGEKYAKKLIKN